MPQPIRIHPQNRKLFEFRGKPLVLLCATEHYGAVMNRPFRFERYLADAAEKQTLTRLFTLFRELQSASNPYSTCKPESPDYIAPFQRVGAALALDQQPKFDLSQWNPEFFERLHRFLALASDYGVVVEVVLLSNTYADNIWALNPLNPANNLNDVEQFNWPEYMSLRHPNLFKWQSAHVRKIVEETNRYDNVFYEICNEPGGSYPGGRTTDPLPAEVNEWQAAIAQVIRETEKPLPNRHLIAGQEAFTWHPFEQTSDRSFADFPLDIVNMHPLPNTTFAGKSYDMGAFMAKELKLAGVRDYALATYAQRKPLNYDEDNCATQYKDEEAWTIHRKRAWTALFCGAHYDMIDFSIVNYLETGTEHSQRCLRTWMKHLSQFIHSIDLVRARPMPELLRGNPSSTLGCVFAAPEQDYCIYLADARERSEPDAGGPIGGSIHLDLPAGDYSMCWYSPMSGVESRATTLEGSSRAVFQLPEFIHDLVVRVRRR